jgi:peroxiredoxin
MKLGCVDEGSEAPDLELQDQDGKVFKLSSMRGKYVVLYFYPKAMTRGCAIEDIEFRDSYDKIVSLGAEVVGVSKDSVESTARIESYAEESAMAPLTLIVGFYRRVLRSTLGAVSTSPFR